MSQRDDASRAVGCHPITEAERSALRLSAHATPATFCGSLASGTYSYNTAGDCPCVHQFENHVQQPPKCTPCMMQAPPRDQDGRLRHQLPLVYVTPRGGCPAAVGKDGPALDRTPARVYTRQADLPLFRCDCVVSPSAVEIDGSGQHIVGIPLPGSYLEALTVEGDTVTATFEPIPCAGGVRPPPIEIRPGEVAPPAAAVPDLRPLLLVPAGITNIVLIPPQQLSCPPVSIGPP